MTVLSYAASCNRRNKGCDTVDEEIVDMLIRAGADVNAKDDNGHTILQQVVEAGIRYDEEHLEEKQKQAEKIVQMLLDANANVNSKASGLTALDIACFQSTFEVVDMLIKAGADVNVKTDESHTILYQLVSKTFEKKIAQGQTRRTPPSRNARHMEAMKKIELLIPKTEDLNLEFNIDGSNWNINFLSYAAMTREEKIVKLLIDAGVDVDHQNENEKSNGLTALMIAVTFGSRDEAERRKMKTIVQMLLDAHANVNLEVKASDDADRDAHAFFKVGWTALNFATFGDGKRLLGAGHEIIQLLKDAEVTQQVTPELFLFLKSINYQKYLNNLAVCEYMTVADLKDASSDDLKECGVPPKVRKSIINGLKSYKDEL